MKKTLHLILLVAVLALTVGCTSSDKPAENRQPQPTDTVYTQQAAMSIYGYQPKRALQIIDSAVIVGHKYGIDGKQETAERLTDQMLGGPMAQYRPITVRITHSEQSGVTALDFMVEQMQATPLSNAHRAALSNECRQVIEEPTKRGFRVKLII